MEEICKITVRVRVKVKRDQTLSISERSTPLLKAGSCSLVHSASAVK